MSKKYYDLPSSRVVCEIDWEKGHGTLEQAKKVLENDIREISKSEFIRLGEIYAGRSKEGVL